MREKERVRRDEVDQASREGERVKGAKSKRGTSARGSQREGKVQWRRFQRSCSSIAHRIGGKYNFNK